MGMAYTKALAIMRRAEKNLGFPLTARRIGGKGGGGSVLTPKAKEFYMTMKPTVTPVFKAAASSILRSFLNMQMVRRRGINLCLKQRQLQVFIKTAFGHNWQPGNREEHAAERNSGTAVLF